jgi:hypothetical protein
MKIRSRLDGRGVSTRMGGFHQMKPAAVAAAPTLEHRRLVTNPKVGV